MRVLPYRNRRDEVEEGMLLTFVDVTTRQPAPEQQRGLDVGELNHGVQDVLAIVARPGPAGSALRKTADKPESRPSWATCERSATRADLLKRDRLGRRTAE